MSDCVVRPISLDEIVKLWEENINNNDYNTIYIDIPFCTQKCSYCIYNKYTFSNEKELDNYLDLLEKEMEFYSKIFKEKYISALYVGGSASVLNHQQNNRLKSLITSYYNINIEENGLRTIELNPADLNIQKIESIFNNPLYNRASLGVQNFSKNVINSNHRRYVSIEDIDEIIKLIKYYNDDININIDLMIGIGESSEEFISSFNSLKNSNINLITVYINAILPQSKELTEKFNFIMKNLDLERYNVHWLDNNENTEVKSCYLFFNKNKIKTYDFIYSLGPSISNRIGFGPLAESQINNINFFYNRDKSLDFFKSKFYCHYKTESEFVKKDFNKFKINNKWIF